MKKLFAPFEIKVHFLYDDEEIKGFVRCWGKDCPYCNTIISNCLMSRHVKNTIISNCLMSRHVKVSQPVEYDILSYGFMRKDA